jgi:hypothetical protein
MINLTISVTEFEDAMNMEEWGIVDAIIAIVKKTVRGGVKVEWEFRYENAPPDIVSEISTEEDLNKWLENVKEMRHFIKSRKK